VGGNPVHGAEPANAVDFGRPETTQPAEQAEWTASEKGIAMQDSPELIRFNVLRNALYHSARRRAFERINRTFNFVVVLLGAAAIGDLLAFAGIDQRLIGAGVATIGASQLVFDFGRQARDHQILQKDYYNLLADIELVSEPTADQCAEWYSRMIRITAEEPPVLKALDARAYNDAIDAIYGFDSLERLRIPFLHRLLGGFFAFDGYEYKKLGDLPNG
jgi:hypothetical protein